MINSLMEKVLGKTAYINVIDMFLNGVKIDYSISDISKKTNITNVHIYKVVYLLVGYGIVIKSRKLAGAQLYKLNRENPITKGLIELNISLIKYQKEKK